MASSFKCIYNYPETLLDTLCQWNDTILAGNLDNTATNFTDAVRATGSSDRSRAKEMYRIGLLCLELTKGEIGLDHIKAGKNAQSDLGFISSVITKAKQTKDSDSLRLAYSALCSIYSLLQSVTIGQTEISLNALIYRLNNIFPCPDDIDFIKWHRYVLSAFLCELKYREYLYSKNPVANPIPDVFEDTLTGKNTAPFSMSIRTNEFKELKLRKTIQSASDVRDAISERVSLTDIFQQKMPLFMFGNDSDIIPKGYYGMANKYFSSFLRAAFEFEVSDSSRASIFEALFDEDSIASAKTDALKAIIDIFETATDTTLITEYNRLMKTIYQGAKDALRVLNKDQKQGTSGQTMTIQTIYYGCPGTGKSHQVKDLTEGLDDEKIIKFDDGTTNVFRTTFHPDYDYATFVGCYKPVKVNDKLDYKFVPQVFTNAYVTAKKHPETPIYLIIEEINRGNCAQIFGDLFQLLDRENGESKFPIDAEEELMKYLRDEAQLTDYIKIKLPANFNIYATMNTSDQSLFPMDSAFKRRWEMKYIKINYAHPDANYTFTVGSQDYHWLEYLPCFNDKITLATDSEDKQMGEFFIRSNMTATEFKNKVMFYLWNDVCKDLYSGKNSPQSFFFRDVYGNPFKFTELFNELPENAKDEDKTDPRKNGDLLLEGFLYYVKNGKKKAPKTEAITEQTVEEPEEGGELAAE